MRLRASSSSCGSREPGQLIGSTKMMCHLHQFDGVQTDMGIVPDTCTPDCGVRKALEAWPQGRHVSCKLLTVFAQTNSSDGWRIAD
jgi:hypothetical protein